MGASLGWHNIVVIVFVKRNLLSSVPALLTAAHLQRAIETLIEFHLFRSGLKNIKCRREQLSISSSCLLASKLCVIIDVQRSYVLRAFLLVITYDHVKLAAILSESCVSSGQCVVCTVIKFGR